MNNTASVEIGKQGCFPYFLIPAIFIGFAYRQLGIGYLNTGRDLRLTQGRPSFRTPEKLWTELLLSERSRKRVWSSNL